MRTTLELDDDLVAMAKQLAKQQGMTLGQVVSQLARESMAAKAPPKVRNGVLLFVPKDSTSRPDLKTVNQLRDEA